MISAPVECLYLFRFICVDTGHETHHLTSGHLGINTLLDDPAAFLLTENTGDIPVLRLQVFLEEGLHYLKACTKTYDMIYDDAYHGILPDSGLLSYEATVLMKKRLKEGGLLVINMIGALQGSSSMRALLSEEVLKRVFRNVELRQNMEIPPDLPSQNLILLGSDAPLPPTRMLRPNDLSEDWAEH